jgi:hypothetical protein
VLLQPAQQSTTAVAQCTIEQHDVHVTCGSKLQPWRALLCSSQVLEHVSNPYFLQGGWTQHGLWASVQRAAYHLLHEDLHVAFSPQALLYYLQHEAPFHAAEGHLR